MNNGNRRLRFCCELLQKMYECRLSLLRGNVGVERLTIDCVNVFVVYARLIMLNKKYKAVICWLVCT
jgi:hypothetical protein